MPDFCTCGAELPPDARFCHKCGKPQRDEVSVEQAAPPPAPPVRAAEPPRAAAPIGFRNPLAVRIGFLTGLIAMLFYFVQPLAFPIWMGSAGFLGVRLYNRRSGGKLSVGEGARIGWLTGVFSFLDFSVFYTFGMVAALKSGALFEQLRKSEVPFLRDQSEQLVQLLQNPVVLAVSLLMTLFLMLLLFAVFTVTGGAIGAKLLGRAKTP